MVTQSNLHISTKELQTFQKEKFPYFLLDVREPWEFKIAALSEAVNIPLAQLENHLSEIPKDCLIIVMCHHGVRSLNAAMWLKQQGFTVKSLQGGIHKWSKEADPSVPIY
jgi:rhodanese-related sulfurtransferase